MPPSPSAEVTQLLLAWHNGEQCALEKLLPLVHGELRKLAHAYMRVEEPDHLLQTTALINEAYLRLVDGGQVNWENRSHFYSLCARLMHQIPVDYARREKAQKRGCGGRPVSLEDAYPLAQKKGSELLALEDALEDLERMDETKARIVELRFFAGLTVEETSAVVGVAAITVWREWEKAKAWLYRAMTNSRRP